MISILVHQFPGLDYTIARQLLILMQWDLQKSKDFLMKEANGQSPPITKEEEMNEENEEREEREGNLRAKRFDRKKLNIESPRNEKNTRDGPDSNEHYNRKRNYYAWRENNNNYHYNSRFSYNRRERFNNNNFEVSRRKFTRAPLTAAEKEIFKKQNEIRYYKLFFYLLLI